MCFSVGNFACVCLNSVSEQAFVNETVKGEFVCVKKVHVCSLERAKTLRWSENKRWHSSLSQRGDGSKI